MKTDTPPKKKRLRPGNRNRVPNAWQRSASFAAIGAETLEWFRAHRHEYKKCDAKAKATGQRCRQIAMANGKCRWHGGATPTGAEWGHRQLRPKPPRKARANDWQKAEAKLKQQRLADDDRIRRLRAMTDPQFYAYTRRMGRRLNDPFASRFRKAVRDEFARRGPDPSRASVSLLGGVHRPPAPNPELEALERRIARLKAELAATADAPAFGEVQTIFPNIGVFE